MTQNSIQFINRVPRDRGATGRIADDMMAFLDKEGWATSLVTSERRAQSAKDYALVWLDLFFKALRVPRADIVVLMTDPPFLVWQVFILKFIKRCKVIYWCQDIYPDLFPLMGIHFPEMIFKCLKTLTRLAIQQCDAVITLGDCMKNTLAGNGVEGDRIIVMPNWAPVYLRVRPQRNDPVLRVLYAGNFGLNHPLDAVLEAAGILRNEKQIEFLFSGTGRKRAALEQALQRRDLPQCRIGNFVRDDQLNDLLADADIHITTMDPVVSGLLVPCKIYSGAAVGRYSVLLGPKDSTAAAYLIDNTVGHVLDVNDGAGLAAFLKETLRNLPAFRQKMAGLFQVSLESAAYNSFNDFMNCARTLITQKT